MRQRSLVSALSEGVGWPLAQSVRALPAIFLKLINFPLVGLRKIKNDTKEIVLEGVTFVEKEFYTEPPDLPEDASDDEIRSAWAEWIKKESKARANHKRQFTKAQKAEPLPDMGNSGLMIKQGGVWRQRPTMTAYVGSAELGTLESVVFELAKQDRHHQARGVAGGQRRSGRRRKSQSKREAKRQRILNSKRNQ